MDFERRAAFAERRSSDGFERSMSVVGSRRFEDDDKVISFDTHRFVSFPCVSFRIVLFRLVSYPLLKGVLSKSLRAPLCLRGGIRAGTGGARQVRRARAPGRAPAAARASFMARSARLIRIMLCVSLLR